MTTILIGDKVQVTLAHHEYKGVEGTVLATRGLADGTVEHQVEFPRRSYTLEERERGEDQHPDENITWLRHDEVAKVET